MVFCDRKLAVVTVDKCTTCSVQFSLFVCRVTVVELIFLPLSVNRGCVSAFICLQATCWGRGWFVPLSDYRVGWCMVWVSLIGFLNCCISVTVVVSYVKLQCLYELSCAAAVCLFILCQVTGIGGILLALCSSSVWMTALIFLSALCLLPVSMLVILRLSNKFE